MTIRLAIVALALLCLFGTKEIAVAAPVDNPAHCIDIEGSGGDFSTMENTCNQTLNVRWHDQGSCRTGCLTTIRPGTRQTITGVRGEVRWAACVYPQSPRPVGGGRSSCE